MWKTDLIILSHRIKSFKWGDVKKHFALGQLKCFSYIHNSAWSLWQEHTERMETFSIINRTYKKLGENKIIKVLFSASESKQKEDYSIIYKAIIDSIEHEE